MYVIWRCKTVARLYIFSLDAAVTRMGGMTAEDMIYFTVASSFSISPSMVIWSASAR